MRQGRTRANLLHVLHGILHGIGLEPAFSCLFLPTYLVRCKMEKMLG
jgi:hypothetical protein